MTTHVVREYEHITLTLPQSAAKALHATGFVSVTPATDGDWRITAREYVGSLVVGDVRLLVRPKIRPDNLFLMLEAGLPSSAWRREMFDYSENNDLLSAVVAFFLRTTETTLARGILRSYREQRESLSTLRGRVDMPAQIAAGGVPFPIHCRYDDYTEDIPENRYLKAALRRCRRVPKVAGEDQRRLLQLLASLEGVEDVPTSAGDLDHITVNRLNMHYQPSLRLARLLLANLTLADRSGSTAASSFMVDMNELYERFLTQRLRRSLRGRLNTQAQTCTYLGKRKRVLMRPDLEFRDSSGSAVFVADIKYKLTGDANARTSDYYQLLAYTTALNLPEGVLIYCLTDGGTEHRSIEVRHTGKVLHVKAIDLTGSPDQVTQQIDELANWIHGRTLGMSLAPPA